MRALAVGVLREEKEKKMRGFCNWPRGVTGLVMKLRVRWVVDRRGRGLSIVMCNYDLLELFFLL